MAFIEETYFYKKNSEMESEMLKVKDGMRFIGKIPLVWKREYHCATEINPCVIYMVQIKFGEILAPTLLGFCKKVLSVVFKSEAINQVFEAIASEIFDDQESPTFSEDPGAVFYQNPKSEILDRLFDPGAHPDFHKGKRVLIMRFKL